MTQIAESELVKSLQKGLAVIEAFDAQHPQMTLSDVAKKTGITRAASRRILLTLVAQGYALQEGSIFSLTPRILKLGYSYLSSLGLWELAESFMKELVLKTGESCSAAVLDNKDVVYVARVPTQKRIMSIKLDVGTRLPAYATSMGRVLLAQMQDEQLEKTIQGLSAEPFTDKTICEPEQLLNCIKKTREQGWALVDEELEIGLRSISVPITDRKGQVKAALNVSTHISLYSREDIIENILPALQYCADQINQSLGNKLATLSGVNG